MLSTQLLFDDVVSILRAQDSETLTKLYYVLESKRQGLLIPHHFSWDTHPKLFQVMKDIAKLQPNGLISKSLTGYYSIGMGAAINLSALVQLVRDLSVTGVIMPSKETDA